MSKELKPDYGYFWLDDPTKPTLDYLHPENYVITEAYAHACPNRLKVIEDFGAEWMLERYATCNEVMEKLVLELARKLNPTLLQLLITPTTRRSDEPVGKYEVDAVPEYYATEMNLGSMSYGYSIPRVIIEVMGRDTTGRLAINYEQLPRLADGVEQAISESQTPFELLAKLSALAFELGVSAGKLLSHIFAQGVIDEQHCVSQYISIEKAMQEYAPTLWEKYSSMSHDEKLANNIWVREQ